MPGALDGVLVADFSRVLAGPYATMLLADLGATVIKVERPGAGDDTRAWGPPYAADGQSTYFHSVNRNKRSLALDIGEPADQRIAQRLAERADIVIENFKPGALTRYGLDYQSVNANNPSVIYCSISGFGTGGGADLPGYDLLVQAMGGLMSITGTDEPTKAGVAVVDVLTGLHATVAILAALRHRELTSEGQLLEVSLLSSLLSSLVNQASGYIGAGVVPTYLGNAHPSISPYEVYQTADRPLVIAVGNDSQFAALAVAIDSPGLVTDTRFATNPARVANRSVLANELTIALATHGADHWRQVLTAVGVPCGPINDISQAFALATELGLDPVATFNHDGTLPKQVANPVRYSSTPITYRLGPPTVGQDNAAIFAELGFS
ncbi:MAG: CoA transferase [Candidatus Nanopelagicales bacterium]|nr:CoA transferase [Candidatus Nanopelagicales bacterium]